MWAFLATEVLFFGGALLGYAVYRAWYPREFAAGSAHLDVWLGGVNTAALLVSSLTMALAIEAVRHDRRRSAMLMLSLTMALGTVFLAIKAYEYREKYHEHLVPGRNFDGRELLRESDLADKRSGKRPDDVAGSKGASEAPTAPSAPGPLELFFSFYFALTGLHALHMVIGLGVVAVMAALTATGCIGAQYEAPLEMTGLYWHFVDIAWIFLYPVLYLIG